MTTNTYIDDLKSYLRITHSLDDTLLASLYSSALAFAKEKTGIEYNSSDALYTQLLRYIVQHFYDNREAITDKTKIEVDYTIKNLIKTIEVRGEYNNS